MPDTVIYEVNVTPQKAIAAEFRAWLHEHVAQMLVLPGFLSARILDQEEVSVEDPDTLTVHYELEDRQALENYLNQYAADMRQLGIDRFGDQFTAHRRILSPDHIYKSDSVPEGYCENCNAYLGGQYCSSCGQRHESRIISLWGLIRGLVGDLFELDSRLWRSLIPLVTRPGLLTREYLGGKRVHYTPPLRMYLVLSILFFLVATFDLNFVESITSADLTTEVGEIDTVEEEQSESRKEIVERCRRNANETDIPIEILKKMAMTACVEIEAGGEDEYVRELVDNIPVMVFFLLPQIAFYMKLLYIGSRRYYVEHLLFLVHFHSAFFLMLTGVVLLSRIPDIIPYDGWITGLSIAAFVIYTLVYIFKSITKVYGQHWIVRLLKIVLLLTTYVISIPITLAIGALLTALIRAK